MPLEDYVGPFRDAHGRFRCSAGVKRLRLPESPYWVGTPPPRKINDLKNRMCKNGNALKLIAPLPHAVQRTFDVHVTRQTLSNERKQATGWLLLVCSLYSSPEAGRGSVAVSPGVGILLLQLHLKAACLTSILACTPGLFLLGTMQRLRVVRGSTGQRKTPWRRRGSSRTWTYPYCH